MFRFIVAAALLAAPGPSLAQGTSKPTQPEIAANFEKWKAALATRNPDTVAALFAPNAILEPTVSNQLRDTPEEVRAYFVDFLKLSPTPTLNERHIRILDDTTAIDAGVWTFDVVRDGKPTWVTARYSFVWEKAGPDWKIQLLHSSMMPEPLAERPRPMSN